ILGRVLFYDKNLSLNNSTSCGSCHKQQHGFGDNQQFSRGLMGKLSSRNTSTLIHTRFLGASAFFWDGRTGLLSDAVLMPVLNQDEMHAIDIQLLPEKLAELSYYPQLFQNAFATPEITVPRIRIALEAFINVLYSANSRVGQFQSTNLTYTELQGEQIFRGKAKCYSCHVGEDFSGYDGSEFFNIGLDYEYTDKGRFYVTGDEKSKGVFKLPSLRNVAESAPYMHDGRFNTLREVIDHYDHGIINNPQLTYQLRNIPVSVLNMHNPASLPDIDFSMYPVQSLNLTETEKQQLEAYLRAMSDPVLLNHPKYSDPFRRQ
ncbi:MAG: cytochrome-c peroxidase, partial [Bacteroidia bacterium]